jgi:hypothetical protein
MPKVRGSYPWALVLCNASDQITPTLVEGFCHTSHRIGSAGSTGSAFHRMPLDGG